MIEHSWQYTARSASRRCNDDTARSVLLTYRKSVGINQRTRLQRLLVSACLDIIDRALARQIERTGKRTLVVDATLNALLHGQPYIHQIVPYILVLVLVDILPISTAVAFAPVLNLAQRIQLVHFAQSGKPTSLLAFRQCAAAYTIANPFVSLVAGIVKCHKLHTIGMEGQKHLRLPLNTQRSDRAQHFVDSHIGHVSASGSSQTAVERHLKRGSVHVMTCKYLSRLLRSHSVTA